MSAPVFDRRSLRLRRQRAAGLVQCVEPVLRELAERLLDRLDDTTRRFSRALDIGGRGVVAPLLRARGMHVVATDLSAAMAARSGAPCLAMDEEAIAFAPASFDLIVASVSLHAVNDLPGTLLQLRQVLAPGGLFLASMPALGTLDSLRTALGAAEAALRGGTSPRIFPFADLRDCAGLLHRAGFQLPVADVDDITLLYTNPLTLLHDLRAAGETNIIAARDPRTPPPTLFPHTLATLPTTPPHTPATLRLGMMTGWAAD